jgi:NADP-dependent 3-hydroxy acid dehydrogenase YdfG
MYVMRAVLPVMRRQRSGHIINLKWAISENPLTERVR